MICLHWASHLFLAITWSFLLHSVSAFTASTRDILLALNSLKSFHTLSLASGVMPIKSSLFLILLVILMSFGWRVQQSRCIHRRLAPWRVSTMYCSTPHLKARIPSLVMQKVPHSFIVSLTRAVKGANGRRGSTLVCHLRISYKALSLGFFGQGGGTALWVFLGLNCFLEHFTATVGTLGAATLVLVNTTSVSEEGVGLAITPLAIIVGTVT